MLRREGAVTIGDFVVVLLEYLAVGLGMSLGEFLVKMGYVSYLNRYGPQEPEEEETEEDEEVKKKKRRRTATSFGGGVSVVP